jgi:CheY-like chemotaxis protein
MLQINKPTSEDFLAGGGEMGALMRAYDWSATALGKPETWPQSLRTALLIQFYNDAYRQTMGPERHPSALGQGGRQCWAEIWPIIGPQIQQVMSGGGATWHENQLVPVTRHGRREQVYWTYGYSPIDEDDGIGGVLVVCRDVTEQVAAEHVPGVNTAEAVATGETVRVIEDEPVVRGVILEMLGEQGYRTLEAVDGPSGLKILQSSEQIDLLITDVGLPGISGRQVADQARESRPDLKILFITGYAESVALADGFLRPGIEMITKPFDLDNLSRRIRAMTSGHGVFARSTPPSLTSRR